MKKLLLFSSVSILLLINSVKANNIVSEEIGKLQVSGGIGTLVIEGEQLSKTIIFVKDNTGRMIVSQEVRGETSQFELSGLQSGTYEVEVKGKKESKFFSVLVK